MPYINVQQSFSLYYEVYGSGYPILFIHPPGMGLATFKYQRPLANHYKLLLFDLRGNGNSGYNHEKVTINLLARDIITLLDELNLDKIVVCGYSNGGSIALELSLSYPERVSGIILLGGFSEVNTFLLRTEFLAGRLIAKMKGIHLLAKVLGAAHSLSKEYEKELEHYVQKVNPQILYETYTVGLQYNCTNRLNEIKVPILLIDGSKDHYLHHYQYKIKNFLPAAELVFITNSRHQLPTKHPNEINQIIQTFMKKNHFNFVR